VWLNDQANKTIMMINKIMPMGVIMSSFVKISSSLAARLRLTVSMPGSLTKGRVGLEAGKCSKPV
jgi:hypothetical protein